MVFTMVIYFGATNKENPHDTIAVSLGLFVLSIRVDAKNLLWSQYACSNKKYTNNN